VFNKKFLIALAIIFFVVDCLLVTLKLTQKHHKPKPIHKPKPHYIYSVYLTSDDGPLASTPILNQLVLDYEFPLTVFLVGRPLSQDTNLEKGYLAYKKNSYIYIGNHSFTHANFHYKRFYKDPQNVVADFEKNEKYLQITSKIARFPGRNVWAINGIVKGEKDAIASAKLLAKKLNYKTFGWDYELRYKKNGEILNSAITHYKRIKQLLKEGKTYTKNHIVILMHDQMYKSAKSQEVLGELVLLLQNDDECKLKLLNNYKTKYKKIKYKEPLYVKASKKMKRIKN